MEKILDIKTIRTTLNMTQVRFAEEFGVDQSTVSDWERGESVPRGPAQKLLASLAKKAARKRAAEVAA